MSQKLHVQKGDLVQIISGEGRKEKLQGRVIKVDVKSEKVYVEGAKLQKKALRKTQENPEGGFEEQPGPIHVSNVKLIERAEKTERPDKRA